MTNQNPYLIHQSLGRPHSCTFTQLCPKFPIGYNGTPHTTPKIAPSGWRNPPQLDVALPWGHPTYQPKQHFTFTRLNRHVTIHYSDRQTDRPTDCIRNMFHPNRPLTLYLMWCRLKTKARFSCFIWLPACNPTKSILMALGLNRAKVSILYYFTLQIAFCCTHNQVHIIVVCWSNL